MTTPFKVAMALLLFSAVAPTEPCEPDAEMLGAVKQYLAWTKEWWGRSLLDEERLELQVVSGRGTTYLYLAARNVLLSYTPVRQGPAVSTVHCNQPSQSWLRCVERVQQYATSPESNPYLWWLLGRSGVQPDLQLELGPICDLTVYSQAADRWMPSSPSLAKEELASTIATVVTGRVSQWSPSTINAAIANNFNIDDPAVYVLVDYVDAMGDTVRVVLYVEINGKYKPKPYAYVVRADFRAEDSLVEKILSSPIKLRLAVPGLVGQPGQTQ